MNIIIKSKTYGKLSFFIDLGGDSPYDKYVFLELGDRHGTLGRQICDGGGFMGSTITANPETLRAECRKWLRQRKNSDKSEIH